MTPTQFGAEAATWQNFYLLTGGAAATLIGLMFIAVTFGSNLVTPETSATARSFIDPSFMHFAHVLATACVLTIPTMQPVVLGVLLVLAAALRGVGLVRVFGHMRAAHEKHGDIELSDWVTGVGVPLACYVALAAAGVAFVAGHAIAFEVLAVATLAVLMNGLFGAWELVIWMAVTRARRP